MSGYMIDVYYRGDQCMNLKMSRGQVVAMILVLSMAMMPVLAFAEAPEFHINPDTDTMQPSQADAFQNQSIVSVTRTLGSPSMVRDNPADPSLRDYIYIGNSTVYIFSMNRDGKTVVQANHYGRGEWDGGLYAIYSA